MCFWTNDKVLKLIDLYRARPVLWDPKDVNYKNKNLKNAAWEEISQTLDMKKIDCERKMNILATQFRREVKRVKDAVNSGIPPEDIRECKWFAYRSMLFLADRGKYKSGTEYSSDVYYDESGGGHIHASPDFSMLEVMVKEDTEDGDGYYTQHLNRRSSCHTPPSSCGEGNSLAESMIAVEGCTTSAMDEFYARNNQQQQQPVLKRKLQQQHDVEEGENVVKRFSHRDNLLHHLTERECEIFGQFVSLKVNKLTSVYARNKVMNTIVNVLFDAENGKYDKPSSQAGCTSTSIAE